MPIMMEYRKYSRGFEENFKTLQMLCQDPTTKGMLELMQSEKWGGVDLTSILWLPIDHIHRTAAVIAELIQSNQQEIHYRFSEEQLALVGGHQVGSCSRGHTNTLAAVQEDMVRLQRVYGAVVATCDTLASSSKEISKTMQSVSDLQDELCGDFSNFVVPGRREVFKGTLVKLSNGHRTNVNAYLFHDVLLTATDGASGFRVFSSKTELFGATVTYADDNSFKLVERDRITGLEVATHVFQAQDSSIALEWSAKIRTVAAMITRSWQAKNADQPDYIPGAILAKQTEHLNQMKVQLGREIRMLQEEEQRYDNLLDSTLEDFTQLRAKQWDIDCERLQVGLTVHRRTREALENPAEEQSGICYAWSTIYLDLYHAGQTAMQKTLQKEQQAEVVSQILDSLVHKLEALEDVLTGFAFQPLKPVSITIIRQACCSCIVVLSL